MKSSELNSTSTPSIGINVRSDGNLHYADLIVDGKKYYETRNTDSLRPYVGKRVAIVRTGAGPATAIGEVSIGEPIKVNAFKFRQLEKKHRVPEGSKFDIKLDGEKYLYPMNDPVRWDNEKPVKNRGIIARKVDEDILNEYRSRILDYLYKKLPTWPEYIVKDFIYQSFKRKTFSSDDDIDAMIERVIYYTGLEADSKWTFYPKFDFNMDIWEPLTEKQLDERIGGAIKMFVNKDAERHDTQAKLLKQHGISQEPVILIRRPDGYELLEGWHRTIQHFKEYPEGFTGPAWVAVSDSPTM